MHVTAWIRAIRPTHWLKNGIILSPLLFAQRWNKESDWIHALAAILAFCAVASAGYLVNDIEDRAKDRLHPTKKHRPIASGVISVTAAYRAAFVLLIGSLMIGYALAPSVAYALFGYAILMYAYSHGLKRIPLVDLLVIALGFVMRVYVGGRAIQVPLSWWLIGCTFIVALLLGVGKRVVEAARVKGSETRSTLNFYTRERTIWMERILSICAVLMYAMYTLSGAHSPWLVLSVLPVMLGVWRYSVLLTRTHAEGPTEMLVRDRWLQGSLAMWILIVVGSLMLA